MRASVVVLKDGLGTMAYAFQSMGFEIAALYEEDRKVSEIYQRNLGEIYECIWSDIIACRESDIPYADVMIAQLPYVPDRTDLKYAVSEKQTYLAKYREIILVKRPKVFLFETSRRMISDPMFEEFLTGTEKAGYCIYYQLYDIREATGLPIREKRVYIVGTLEGQGMSFQFPERMSDLRYEIEAICQPLDGMDRWYIDSAPELLPCPEEDSAHFYCWRATQYIRQDIVDWNTVKVPLVRADGVTRKITHREVARMKGIPDEYYLDPGNKAWLYKKLYPRAIKFTRFLGARGHIRAINLANHIVREYNV